MLCCSDPENQYNNILVEGLERNKDYQTVSREQWNFLVQTYTLPHIPYYTIKRAYENMGVGIRTFVDTDYQELFTLFSWYRDIDRCLVFVSF